MDKETYNQDFIHWSKVKKDALCDAMDNILGEAARKGDSIQHVADVVKALYEQYPGLEEYKAERFKQACPSGEVYGPYMPIPEVECLPYPDTTIAKAIDKETSMNDTQGIRGQIRRIEFYLQSIEDKLPAYDPYKMKAISMLSEKLKEEIDENN